MPATITTITDTRPGGTIARITIDNPGKLNVIDTPAMHALVSALHTVSADPVVLGNQTPITGTPTVTINTIASAYNSTGPVGTIDAGSSTTINNTNAAISGGVNQIVGAPSGLNALYSGGYGPTAGNVQVGGNQIGINTINGVGAAFAAGTAVTLSQLPGAPSPGGSGSGVGGGSCHTVSMVVAGGAAGGRGARRAASRAAARSAAV